MLNADSSALKSDSDDQSRKIPPMIPSVAALSWIAWTTRRIVSSELERERAVELAHEEIRGVGPVREAEERERQEDERHERQEREVRDHRREVRAAVAKELGERLSHEAEYALW